MAIKNCRVRIKKIRVNWISRNTPIILLGQRIFYHISPSCYTSPNDEPHMSSCVDQEGVGQGGGGPTETSQSCMFL